MSFKLGYGRKYGFLATSLGWLKGTILRCTEAIAGCAKTYGPDNILNGHPLQDLLFDQRSGH
jgi:hypothetical protein